MKAKDVLSEPSRWTQGACGRDKLGRPCSPLSENAVQYCIVGALMRAYSRELHNAVYDRAIKAIVDIYGEEPISMVYWNDEPGRTFADVKKVLETADV
jgi:hypothetical protein